jgi:hypothetical protein
MKKTLRCPYKFFSLLLTLFFYYLCFLHSIPFVFIYLQTKGPLCSVPEYNYYFRMVKAPPPLTSQRRLLFSLSRLADILFCKPAEPRCELLLSTCTFCVSRFLVLNKVS